MRIDTGISRSDLPLYLLLLKHRSVLLEEALRRQVISLISQIQEISEPGFEDKFNQLWACKRSDVCKL